MRIKHKVILGIMFAISYFLIYWTPGAWPFILTLYRLVGIVLIVITIIIALYLKYKDWKREGKW
jgi:asparagine N-glycosylation enzyme membrane subunit Stt3